MQYERLLHVLQWLSDGFDFNAHVFFHLLRRSGAYILSFVYVLSSARSLILPRDYLRWRWNRLFIL